jgi:hypothetical protein
VARRGTVDGERGFGQLRGSGLRTRLGVAVAFAEQGGAPRGDGEAGLVERKRKRHLYRLTVVVVLALMDDAINNRITADWQNAVNDLRENSQSTH